MEQKIDEIKFGLLSEHELNWLKNKIEREKENRNTKAEEYIDVIYANDGCEGFYCKVEKFHEINSKELHQYIIQTLEQGSEIGFSVDKVSIEEYNENCKRYEWNFDDAEEDEDDNEL
jgi:hypothetical protein